MHAFTDVCIVEEACRNLTGGENHRFSLIPAGTFRIDSLLNSPQASVFRGLAESFNHTPVNVYTVYFFDSVEQLKNSHDESLEVYLWPSE